MAEEEPSPDVDNDHVHRWKISTPISGVSVGTCHCGRERTFIDQEHSSSFMGGRRRRVQQ